MPLVNYSLSGPSTVILEDRRDPEVSWANHLARTNGQRGGVDLVAAVGTPVLAPTDGWLDQVPDDGGAGNSTRFRHRDNPGWADVFSHLSAYNGRSGQFFNKGDLIALSGRSGGVTQHLHRHLLDPNGVRRNPWHYFTSLVASTQIGSDMADVKIISDNSVKNPDGSNRDQYLRGEGGVIHIRSAEDLKALQDVLLKDQGTFRQIKIAESYLWALQHGYKTQLLIDFTK